MFTVTNEQKIVLTANPVNVNDEPVDFTEALVWELSDVSLGSLVPSFDTHSCEFIAADGAEGSVVVTARMGDITGTIDGSVTDEIGVAFRINIVAGEPQPK